MSAAGAVPSPRPLRNSLPISRPDRYSSAASGGRSPASARARAEKSNAVVSRLESRAVRTPSANADAARSAEGASDSRANRPSMECALSTAYNSPVMKVLKAAMRWSRMRTHLECVPGQITKALARSCGSQDNAPITCVSSPRITSADSTFCERPATICTFTPSTSTSAFASSAAPAGTGQYGASTQPCTLPTIPHAMVDNASTGHSSVASR